MNIRAIQHCGLVVRDLARSLHFYGTVLGMSEVSRPTNFAFRGAWFRQGECEVHLILAEDTTAPAGLPNAGAGREIGLATHVAFEVDDLDALVRRLRAHRADVVGGPVPRGDGAVQLFVADPDGYLLEFFQRTGRTVPAPERGPARPP